MLRENIITSAKSLYHSLLICLFLEIYIFYFHNSPGTKYKSLAVFPPSLLAVHNWDFFRPGVGKTTVMREIARVLSDEFHKRVVSCFFSIFATLFSEVYSAQLNISKRYLKICR